VIRAWTQNAAWDQASFVYAIWSRDVTPLSSSTFMDGLHGCYCVTKGDTKCLWYSVFVLCLADLQALCPLRLGVTPSHSGHSSTTAVVKRRTKKHAISQETPLPRPTSQPSPLLRPALKYRLQHRPPTLSSLICRFLTAATWKRWRLCYVMWRFDQRQ